MSKVILNNTQWKVFEEAGCDMTQYELDKKLNNK